MNKKITFNDRYGLTEAVLNGVKTMTRRIEFNGIKSIGFIFAIKRLKEDNLILNFDGKDRFEVYTQDNELLEFHKCRYAIGEVIAIAQNYRDANCKWYEVAEAHQKGFYGGQSGFGNKMFVKASLMPHHICITNIKIERLQDISEKDCINEGIIPNLSLLGGHFHYFLPNKLNIEYHSPIEAFSVLIDKISRKGTWEENPYVIVYEFEKID